MYDHWPLNRASQQSQITPSLSTMSLGPGQLTRSSTEKAKKMNQWMKEVTNTAPVLPAVSPGPDLIGIGEW